MSIIKVTPTTLVVVVAINNKKEDMIVEIIVEMIVEMIIEVIIELKHHHERLGKMKVLEIHALHGMICQHPKEKLLQVDTIKVNENKFTLTLPSIRLVDIGQYSVTASDKTGDTSASFSVNVITEADL